MVVKPMKLKFVGGPWDGEEKNMVLRGPDFFLGTNGFYPAKVHVYSLVTRDGRPVLEYRGLIASATIA